jgi:hypothetical protein
VKPQSDLLLPAKTKRVNRLETVTFETKPGRQHGVEMPPSNKLPQWDEFKIFWPQLGEE